MPNTTFRYPAVRFDLGRVEYLLPGRGSLHIRAHHLDVAAPMLPLTSTCVCIHHNHDMVTAGNLSHRCVLSATKYILGNDIAWGTLQDAYPITKVTPQVQPNLNRILLCTLSSCLPPPYPPIGHLLDRYSHLVHPLPALGTSAGTAPDYHISILCDRAPSLTSRPLELTITQPVSEKVCMTVMTLRPYRRGSRRWNFGDR